MTESHVSHWIPAPSAKAKRTIAKAVKAKAKTGVCLIDDCAHEAHKRGICARHYSQFVRTKNSLPRDQRCEFDLGSVREGKILGSGQIRQILSDNPFAA